MELSIYNSSRNSNNSFFNMKTHRSLLKLGDKIVILICICSFLFLMTLCAVKFSPIKKIKIAPVFLRVPFGNVLIFLKLTNFAAFFQAVDLVKT